MPDDNQNYYKDIPAPTNDDFDNPSVHRALEIWSEWNNLNSSDFNTREYLNRQADLSMSDSTNPVDTTKKINNQLGYIAVRKVKRQMAERIFKVKGGNIDVKQRALLKMAFIKYLELSGYRNTWLDKEQMLRTGDQFITAGGNPNYINTGKGFPFRIVKKSITQLSFPGWVTSLVDKGDNRHARQYVQIIFDGEWDEAIIKYPWLLENGGTSGTIPMNKDDWNMNTQTERQRAYNSVRRTQIIRFIDEDRKLQLDIGGRTAVANKPLEGEDFPNMDRFGNTSKNIFQQYCFGLSNGLLNTGILQSTNKLSIIDGVLQSIGYTYEMINLNSIKIVKTDMEPEVFKADYNQALADQANLKEGVVYSRGDIGVASTTGSSLMNEMFAALDQVIKDFARLDIIIDDALTDPQKTLGALKLESVSQSKGVRELQRQNAEEEQRFIDYATDWIIQNIDDDNDVELSGIGASVRDENGKEQTINGRTIKDEFGKDVFVNLTCGEFAREIRETGIRFEVVPESGIKINEGLSRMTAEQNANRYAQLGLPQLAKEELKRIKILDGESEADIDFLEQQEMPQQPQGEQGAQVQELPMSETQKI